MAIKRILPPTGSAFAETARLHRLAFPSGSQTLKGGVNFFSTHSVLTTKREQFFSLVSVSKAAQGRKSAAAPGGMKSEDKGFFNSPFESEAALSFSPGWDRVREIIPPKFSQKNAHHPGSDEDGARQGEIEQIVTGVYLVHQNPHGGSNGQSRKSGAWFSRHAPGRRDL